MLLCGLTDKDLRRIYWNLDAHIGSHILYEDLYRLNRNVNIAIPFVIGMLLARDSIVGISIPSSILLPASLFSHSIIQHLVTNSLVICCKASYDVYY